MSTLLSGIDQHPLPYSREGVLCAIARVPWITTALVVLVVTATLAPAAIEYDRAVVLDGQWWRVLTCHFAHFTTGHLAWCLVALVVLGVGCERVDRRAMIAVTMTSMLLIPVALLVLEPDRARYRGFSGVESGWFVMLLWHVLRVRLIERDWIGFAAAAAIGIGFVAKILIEMRFGATVFVGDASGAFEPEPLAHLAGIAGAVIALAVVKLARRR